MCIIVCPLTLALKFAGYIHHHKILPGNLFGLIWESKMVATGLFRLSARSFVGPLEQRVLKTVIGPRGLQCNISLREIMG